MTVLETAALTIKLWAHIESECPPTDMTLALLSCQRLHKTVYPTTDRYWCDRWESNPNDTQIKSLMPYHLATIAYKSRLTHPRELASSPIIRAAIVIVTAPKRIILCSAQFKNHLLGGPGWNRTSDTGIFSPLLYRLSYRTIFTLPFYATTMILAWGTSPLHRTRNSRHNFEASGVRTLHLWWTVAASTFPLLSYRSI